jgi:post-segregation antitoxin (ccd killing protein)
MGSQDWFERLTGFREDDYAATQNRLIVDGDALVSTVNDKRYGVGNLSLPTLAELRCRVRPPAGQRSTVGCLVGDARALHSEPEFDGALFQVASQFNLLEMVSPHVTPEDGVARYAGDPTQGPACAMAAGAATIYRNYCAPVNDGFGQTRDRQLDALAQLSTALSDELSRPVNELWQMRNGYALCTTDGLEAITDLLDHATEERRDALRGKLAIGLHRNVEVTDVTGDSRRYVSQAFCSALPVAYSPIPQPLWASFARLVLEAAYEATLLAAVEQATAGGSKTVLLTRLGGGAFGNDTAWIDHAIERALTVAEHAGLDIRLVSSGSVNPAMQAIADRWNHRSA